MKERSETFIRLCSLTIEGMKNIEQGRIDFYNLSAIKKCPNSIEGNSVWGIYGQNGSGKTGVIDAVAFLKMMLSGKMNRTGFSLDSDPGEFIHKKKKFNKNTFLFLCKTDKYITLLEYMYTYSFGKNGAAILSKEELSETVYDSQLGKWKRKKKLFSFNREEWTLKLATSQRDNRSISKTKVRILSYTDIYKVQSAIFTKEAQELLEQLPLTSNFENALHLLKSFAERNLVVLNNPSIGEKIGDHLLLNCHIENSSFAAHGLIPVISTASRKSMIPSALWDPFKMVCDQINIPLKHIVPNLSLKITNEETTLDEQGNEMKTFDLVTEREGLIVPLHYESEGIKRIISILNALIFFCSDPNACVWIDEMDAGVYEYLLGELLVALTRSGQGQLVFTAHNLRPLERLGKDHIIFSTANPQNRFLMHQGIKTTNNLRDVYLREIYLGSEQEERLNDPLSGVMIEHAFRKAAKANG